MLARIRFIIPLFFAATFAVTGCALEEQEGGLAGPDAGELDSEELTRDPGLESPDELTAVEGEPGAEPDGVHRWTIKVGSAYTSSRMGDGNAPDLTLYLYCGSDGKAIAKAIYDPPKDTRAYFRGMCLQKYSDEVVSASWDSVIFDLKEGPLKKIFMLEPLRGTEAHVRQLFDESATAGDLLRNLGKPSGDF